MPGIQTRTLNDGTVRFFVRVRDPRRGKFTSKTFATEPEAAMFCRDIADRGAGWALDQLDRHRGDDAEPTLDAWAQTHFSALTKPAATTVARYRRIYAARWSPHLGSLRLSQIGRVEVARALNAQTGSDKTMLNAWGVLTHMFKTAVQDGLLTRSPTVGVTPPRRTDHETEEHRYLTHEEFAAVLAATPTYWQPLVLMLIGTGMRWGEAAALTVGDVDLEQGVVRVTKAEKQDPANPTRTVVGPTKSRKSRRTITLPGEVADAVRPLIDARRRNERLFLPPKGGPLRHRTFYRDIWLKKCLPGSGIREPHPRLHDLRHTHVAWLIALGTPLPVIQARLGHEKITTTIDTYGHLLPELQKAAADAASSVLAGVMPHKALG